MSPVLWAFVLSGTGIGVAAGFLDSSVNTAVALANRNRLLNMLHGCYGIGTTIGPLVITAALLAGSWRPGYGVLLAVELVDGGGWWLAGRRLEARALEGDAGEEDARRADCGPAGGCRPRTCRPARSGRPTDRPCPGPAWS